MRRERKYQNPEQSIKLKVLNFQLYTSWPVQAREAEFDSSLASSRENLKKEQDLENKK